MFRKLITSRAVVPVVLCLQVVPLAIFPLSTFKLTSQEWWLPAFLTLLTLISLIQILVRRDQATWPWYLLSFAQGFNIISRMMMLFPHAMVAAEGGGQIANGPYLILTFAAMFLSAFEIWYCELPEVRQKLASRSLARAHS